MISVEVAGPSPYQTYTLVPDTVRTLAAHIVNECVGRAGKVGGFATLDIGRLIDFVIDPCTDLAVYCEPLLLLPPPPPSFPLERNIVITMFFVNHVQQHHQAPSSPSASRLPIQRNRRQVTTIPLSRRRSQTPRGMRR